MILPDLNLLLYAYNPQVPQHAAAHSWWEGSLNDDELIAFPHEILFGFVRIATNRRLGKAAVSMEKARAVVEQWIQLPQARVITPSAGHFSRVLDLMESAQARGAILSDAILAAYAIEHRACLCTNDMDFGRFPGLRWINPLQKKRKENPR